MGRNLNDVLGALAREEQMSPLRSVLTRPEIEAIAKALELGVQPIREEYRAQCNSQSLRGSSDSGLPRLSRTEYFNTLVDIFGQDLVNGISSLSVFPAESLKESITEFNQWHAFEHVSASLNIGLEVGQKVAANASWLARVAPTCLSSGVQAGSVSDACVLQFVREFGLKIHRRPLTAAQEQMYLAFFKAGAISSLTTIQKIEVLIARFLQAPEFQFHWSVSSSPVGAKGSRAKVDQYTIASRIAYRVAASPPDALLMQAAARGELATLEQVQAQALRVLETARGRLKVRSIVAFWLRLNSPILPTANAAIRAGIDGSDQTRLRVLDELIRETLDYTEYLIFNANATFADLMTSDLAFPRSQEVARLFASPVFTSAPVRVGDGRRGLLMRPALLLSGSDRESPIKRGVQIRRRILCEEIPSPPPSLDGEIAERTKSFDHSLFSSREVAEKITGSGSCIGCHSSINPPGFALGNFGAFGQFQLTEKVYGTGGKFIAEYSIDTNAKGLNLVKAGDGVKGHVELAGLVAQSPKAHSCMAVYLFRGARNRLENPADSCQLAEGAELLSSGQTIKRGLVANVASEDIFWRGF